MLWLSFPQINETWLQKVGDDGNCSDLPQGSPWGLILTSTKVMVEPLSFTEPHSPCAFDSMLSFLFRTLHIILAVSKWIIHFLCLCLLYTLYNMKNKLMDWFCKSQALVSYLEIPTTTLISHTTYNCATSTTRWLFHFKVVQVTTDRKDISLAGFCIRPRKTMFITRELCSNIFELYVISVFGEHGSPVGFGGNEGGNLLRARIPKEEDMPE